MRKYRLTTPARLDLIGILDYLKGNSPIAAHRFIARLHIRLDLLADFPASGHTRSDLGRNELRYITLAPYTIAYLPGSDPLRIVAILHSSRNLKAELKNR